MNPITYKVKCKSCGNVREFVFGRNGEGLYSDFILWINEHTKFPVKNTCECLDGYVCLHDIIAYSQET